MYGVICQLAPVHFSINGTSTQRITSQNRQHSLQSEQSATYRQIRSPCKSKWSIAADLLMLQMVIIRQIHPEKAEICWQGIADALVRRGYLEAGLTAGAVLSRFFTVMHNSMRPLPLDHSRIYDTIAMMFHDRPNVVHKKTRPNPRPSRTNIKEIKLEKPADCADSKFSDKRTAIRAIDQASLKAHCAQVLGIHHCQRPDLMAHERQSKSLHPQPSQSSQIILNNQSSRPKVQSVAQLPTPVTSSDPCPTISSQQPPRSPTKDASTLTIDHKRWSSQTQAHAIVSSHRGTTSTPYMSKPSRKRAHSTNADHGRIKKAPRVQESLDVFVPTSNLDVDMSKIFKAESVAAAKFRAEKLQELREKQIKPNHPKGRLFLSAVLPKNLKRETCFMRHRMESETLNHRNTEFHSKTDPHSNRVRKHKDSAWQRSSTRGCRRPENHTSRMKKKKITRIKSDKRGRAKSSKNTSTDIYLPSSSSETNHEKLGDKILQHSSQDSRYDKLVRRVRERNAANLPMVDINVTSKEGQSQHKRDIVQEVFERVKKSRLEKAAKIARG